MAENSKKLFQLAGGSNDFSSRMDDVFGCFDTIELKHSAQVKVWQQNDDISNDRDKIAGNDDAGERNDDFLVPKVLPKHGSRSRGRRSDKRSRESESNVSRFPRSQPRKYGQAKGPPRDPSKWKSYDLSTVSQGDMSERANTSAAFSFLNDLKKRKQASEEDKTNEEDADADQSSHAGGSGQKSSQSSAITFKKPREQVEEDNEQKSSRLGGKYTMPEYVVGQGKKRKLKPNTKSAAVLDDEISGQTNSVSLSYLADDLCDDSGDKGEANSSAILFKKTRISKGLRSRRHDTDDDV